MGEHLVPHSKYIARGSENWGIRLSSLLPPNELDKDINLDSVRRVGLLKLDMGYKRRGRVNEQDLYDPYPTLNAADTIFTSIISVLTELSFGRFSAIFGVEGGANDVSYDICREHLRDICDFINLFFRPEGRVVYTANFDFDITWGELRTHLLTVVSKDNLSMLYALQDALLTIRNQAPIFWNSQGFMLEPLYFGSLYHLLVDKYANITRPALQINLNVDLRHVSLPSIMPGSPSNLLKHIISYNFNVLMRNCLGKALYCMEAS